MLKNIKITAFTNFFSLLLSLLLVLLVPKFMGVDEFGYWQLYLLYTSFTALLHFGWTDGLLVNLTKLDYKEVEGSKWNDQYKLLTLFSTSMSFLFIIILLNFTDQEIFFAICIGISSMITIPRAYLLNSLIAWNKFREYSISLISNYLIQSIFITIFVLNNQISLEKIIISDLISKFISLGLAIFFTKHFKYINLNSKKHSSVWTEISLNIRVGFFISISYVINYLIISYFRLVIESRIGITYFSKISLNLSLINLIITFINALALAIFPVLGRIKASEMNEMIPAVNRLLSVLMYLAFFLYYPLSIVASIWLPEYKESLQYSYVIFPMVLIEAKIIILIVNFLKVVNKEKFIFYGYLISLLISILITNSSFVYIGTSIFKVMLILLLISIFKYFTFSFLFKKFSKGFSFVLFSYDLITLTIFSSVNYYFELPIAILLFTAWLFVIFLTYYQKIFDDVKILRRAR